MRRLLLPGLGLALAGCVSHHSPPVTMAPPVAAPPPLSAPGPSASVADWRSVPQGQRVPILRAVFDQGGYQLYGRSGETIVVPFENENMYVLKFGQTSGESYFVNEGASPVLYLRHGQFLENASVQGARWYPFSQNHVYDRPVHVGIAPSWAEFLAMGWYAGMIFHGGYWGYHPWVPGFYGYSPMVGLNINIGGRGYDWGGYRSYYRSNPSNRYNIRNVYNNNRVRRTAGGGFGRSTGSGGSFGRGGYSPARPGVGSSGYGRTVPGYGRSSSGYSRSAPSYGYSDYQRRPGGSFGSGTSGYSRMPRSSGGSFGRSSGGFRSGGSFGRRR